MVDLEGLATPSAATTKNQSLTLGGTLWTRARAATQHQLQAPLSQTLKVSFRQT
jgi:hypothetical protein